MTCLFDCFPEGIFFSFSTFYKLDFDKRYPIPYFTLRREEFLEFPSSFTGQKEVEISESW